MHPQDVAQQAYQFVISPAHLLILAWLASVGISKMPAPGAKSKPFYVWIYGVLQVVGANLEKSTISLSATAAAAAPPQGPGAGGQGPGFSGTLPPGMIVRSGIITGTVGTPEGPQG